MSEDSDNGDYKRVGHIHRPKGGRPGLDADDYVEIIDEYLRTEYAGDAIPSRAGLCRWKGWTKSRLTMAGARNPSVAEALERLDAAQEAELLNGGLRGRLNDRIAALVMRTTHGYHDKVKVENEVSYKLRLGGREIVNGALVDAKTLRRDDE